MKFSFHESFLPFAGHSLSFDFPDGFGLFENLSFDLTPGQVLLLKGQNGSGKSTFLQVLLKLRQQKKGQVSLSNFSFKSFSFLPLRQGNKPFDHLLLDFLYHLVFLTSLRQLSLQFLTRVFHMTLLHDKKHLPLSLLSLGQSHRYQLLFSILVNRTFWILDEPFIGLDTYWQHVFSNLQALFQYHGGMIILATHQKMNGRQLNVLSFPFYHA